eukprot:1141927-Prorocentrum_minimum.AAC.9
MRGGALGPVCEQEAALIAAENAPNEAAAPVVYGRPLADGASQVGELSGGATGGAAGDAGGVDSHAQGVDLEAQGGYSHAQGVDSRVAVCFTGHLRNLKETWSSHRDYLLRC